MVSDLRQQQISDCVFLTWYICPQPFWVGQEEVTSVNAVCVGVCVQERDEEQWRARNKKGK